MTEIHIPDELHRRFLDDFGEGIECVGFFLADFDHGSRRFDARGWKAVSEEDYEVQTDFHVSLRDHVRGEVIKWAWDANACLIEVHSHGPMCEAEFSPSDLTGFDAWVPHLWWRLRSRPYAAMVTAGETIDAMAWVEAADRPERVASITVGSGILNTTGRTITKLRRHE